MSTHIDTILNISILVSLIFIYFHVPKAIRLFITGNVNKIEVVEDLDVEVKNSINDKEKFFEKWLKIFKIIYYVSIFFILIFLFLDSQYPGLLSIKEVSLLTKRCLKLLLAFLLNIALLYINYTLHGLKSWRSWLSIFSLITTIFLAYIIFNPGFIKFIFVFVLDLLNVVSTYFSFHINKDLLYLSHDYPLNSNIKEYKETKNERITVYAARNNQSQGGNSISNNPIGNNEDQGGNSHMLVENNFSQSKTRIYMPVVVLISTI